MARSLAKKQNVVKKIVKKVKVTSKQAATGASSTNNSRKLNFQAPKSRYIEGVGRRKVATARVRIYDVPGEFVVNDVIVGQYFDEIMHASAIYLKPLEVVGLKGKVTITAKVSGSGIRSQLDAVNHGVARALLEMNPEFRPFLKEAGLLTRDDRMKETRKIGMGGKARRKRQSPKR
jgi:small subunit ribosomal protein S9